MFTKFQIEHRDQNHNVPEVGHRTTFPHTHIHFRPDIEISRKTPIASRCLELKKKQLKKTNMLGVAVYEFRILFCFEETTFRNCHF